MKDSVSCWELSCGCIQHQLVGFIRRCGVHGARSLSGKRVKLDADVGKHNQAAVVRTYRVAPILP